jgi:ABC-type microcin C transport system duplicated ATPase subunit YejF
LRAVRGNDISLIFQEPMTSLNPLHTVEKQIGEVLKLHQGMREAGAAPARWSCSTRSASAIRKAAEKPIRTSFRAASASA